MKKFTLTSKIYPEITLIVEAANWDDAEKLIFGIGLDLEDWDY